MKILHVVSEAYETGGEERTLKLLHDKLLEAGHTSLVLASDVNAKRRDPSDSFAHYTFPRMNARTPIGHVTNQLFYLKSYRKMRDVLRSENPDVVHLYTMEQVSPSILFLLKKYPVVMTVAGPEFYFPPLLVWNIPPYQFKDPNVRTYTGMTPAGKLRYIFHNNIQSIVYRYGLRNVNTAVVHSRYMNDLASNYFPNVTYVRGVINPYEQAPLQHADNLLCIGRLEDFKGFQYVIQALPSLLKSFPNLKLNIVGDGSYRHALETLATRTGVQTSVMFRGWLKEPATYHAFVSSTIVIVPSVWPEAFGKVGPEALSVGRPVIASDVGGVRDWLHDGENGYLVKPADPDSIADKLTKLLTNQNLIRRMAAEAAVVGRSFRAELYVDRLAAIYRRLTSEVANSFPSES